jgi:cytochrome c oxidase subunit 3
MYFHSYKYSELLLIFSFIVILLVMIVWWRDVIREATYQGHHTLAVQKSLRIGMLLFILSEVCFFFSFFWGFFHSSLSPSIDIGATWPPIGIQAFNPFEIPLLNTAILLSSGATVTWSHHALISGNRKESILALILTIILGIFFTALQGLEYYEASFSIADSVYGSTFFVATGFHGLHVIIGTTFLIVCLFRLINHQFTKHHHNGYEASIWYWHFVDYVWIFLYICIYWWGS